MTGRPASEIVRSRDGQLERRCIACREWKAKAEFSRIGIRWRSKCRDCTRAYNAARPRKR